MHRKLFISFTTLLTLAVCWTVTGCVSAATHAKVEDELTKLRYQVKQLKQDLDSAAADKTREQFRQQSAKEKLEKMQKGWELMPVVVANRDIVEGSVLDYDMVAKNVIPERFVTPSIVKPNDFEKVVGQRLAVPLMRGDPLLWTTFRMENSHIRLSSDVRKKGRAVSIKVDEATGVAGLIRTNDHVDVLRTYSDPRTKKMVCTTLLEDVIVLATGEITGKTNLSQIKEDQRKYSTVTLIVLPEEAEILALASSQGVLSLALRNPEDSSTRGKGSKATLKDLKSEKKRKNLKRKRLKDL